MHFLLKMGFTSVLKSTGRLCVEKTKAAAKTAMKNKIARLFFLRASIVYYLSAKYGGVLLA
jgi:hypothetical protein